MDRAQVVFDSEKQLWTMPSRDAETKGEHGWFVAPSSECFELYVNAPFPISGPRSLGSGLHIARVLIDASGNPVRAALYHWNPEWKEGEVAAEDHMQKADIN